MLRGGCFVFRDFVPINLTIVKLVCASYHAHFEVMRVLLSLFEDVHVFFLKK